VKIGDITPPVEHHTAFELYALNRIVDCTGCYCLTNAGGDVLYVGQAVSVRQRLVQHFNSEKRTALTIYGRASRAWWRTELPRKLDALERGWLETIRLYDGVLPPLNRVSAPI
jgi:predicted GIY-YIG superfamily endonuclease